MAAKMSTIVISMVIMTGLLMSGPAIAQAVDAKTVAVNMDKTTRSTAEVKAYLKDLKGKTITADGKIHDILTGKTGTRVVLHVDTPKSRDFVVDIYVDSANKLHKGDHVACKGQYVKYNMFTVNGITLKDGSCSKN